MRKTNALFLISILSFTFILSGCLQSEKDKVLSAATEILCVTKEMTEKMENINSSDAVIAELSNLDESINEILKKHGFENQEDFENISANYEGDTLFEKEKRDKAAKDCKFEY